MANSKKSGTKGPDAFQKELQQNFRWAVEHSVTVGIAVAALVVLGLAYAGYDYYSNTQEAEAQAGYYRTEDAYLKKVDGAREQARTAAPEDQAAPSSEEPVDLTGLDLNSEIEGFKSIVEDYSGTEAAAMSAIQLSYILSQRNQTDEAIAILSEVKPSDNDLLGALIIHRLGSLQAQAGDCEKAIESFKSIVSSNQLTYLHSEAQLKMGLCYETMGQAEEARQAYQSASEAGAEQGAGQTANQYLRLLSRSAQGEG